jgi:MFS family permease
MTTTPTRNSDDFRAGAPARLPDNAPAQLADNLDIGLAHARRPRSVRPGVLLAIILVAQLMAILDANIVNVAAATIRADLRTSDAGLQLVLAGYTIAYAVLLITGSPDRRHDRSPTSVSHRSRRVHGRSAARLDKLSGRAVLMVPAPIALGWAAIAWSAKTNR